ncbi:hypothetical protein ACFU7T_10480 [Streptomyces sp. NPDC057555]|uniref:hypothetical protein n=1 Tax=Streptomyces sp. NPDC057555 TaxID=3346166 RepID=UPI00367C5B80
MSAVQLAALARTSEPRTMLRRFLALDSVVTTGNGLAYLAASGPLGRFLGVDGTLLLGLGAFLTLFGACVGVLASRKSPPVLPAQIVVDLNAVWAVLSLVSLIAWFDATTVGAVWIPLQAVVVGGFSALQYGALRAVRA